MKVLEVNLPLWKWQGFVFTGGSGTAYQRVVKRDFGADVSVGPHACGHAYVEYGRPFTMWLETRDNLPALAHEALHIAAGVLEARGLTFANPSEEAYTYTMEDIIRQVQTAKPRDWKAMR